MIRNKYMIQQEIPEVIPASQCRHDGIIDFKFKRKNYATTLNLKQEA